MVFACREGVLVSRTKAVNELKSLVVVAPERLRAQLHGRSLAVQLTRIEQLQTESAAPVEHRLSVFTGSRWRHGCVSCRRNWSVTAFVDSGLGCQFG